MRGFKFEIRMSNYMGSEQKRGMAGRGRDLEKLLDIGSVCTGRGERSEDKFHV